MKEKTKKLRNMSMAFFLAGSLLLQSIGVSAVETPESTRPAPVETTTRLEPEMQNPLKLQ